MRFVRDLMDFHASEAGKARLKGRSLYLLRNADTRSRGLGFATAGNFYPDFLLWLVDDDTGRQWLTFVDPKGIRNLSLSDPKFSLFEEVKAIERTLATPNITLNAFILSVTPYGSLINLHELGEQADLEDRHVLFMSDGPEVYFRKLLDRLG